MADTELEKLQARVAELERTHAEDIDLVVRVNAENVALRHQKERAEHDVAMVSKIMAQLSSETVDKQLALVQFKANEAILGDLCKQAIAVAKQWSERCERAEAAAAEAVAFIKSTSNDKEQDSDGPGEQWTHRAEAAHGWLLDHPSPGSALLSRLDAQQAQIKELCSLVEDAYREGQAEGPTDLSRGLMFERSETAYALRKIKESL